jgi:hypothetical protein
MSTREILDDLKKMMIMTGQMSDLHYKNLVQWGKIVFENYDSVEISYNINNTDPNKFKKLTGNALENYSQSFIRYKVIPKKGKRMLKKNAEQALNTLTLWIGDIFWTGIQVQIFIKDKEYKGLT